MANATQGSGSVSCVLEGNDVNPVPGRSGDCGTEVAASAVSFFYEVEELIWSFETCLLNLATVQTGCKASVSAHTNGVY